MTSLLFVAAMTAGWASIAADAPAHLGELQKAMRALGAEFIPGSGETIRRASGREDYALTSRTGLKTLLSEVRASYRSQRNLSGFRVVGYARLNRRSSWSVTLRRGQLNHIVEIREHRLGAQVAFRSMTIDRGFRRHGPLRPLPHPVAPRVRPRPR